MPDFLKLLDDDYDGDVGGEPPPLVADSKYLEIVALRLLSLLLLCVSLEVVVL
jgi:hypothetical protein